MNIYHDDFTNGWIELDRGLLCWQAGFLAQSQADNAYLTLKNGIIWEQKAITLFGRRCLQPRLQAWHGDKSYRYSGLKMEPRPWTPELLHLRTRCEQAAGTTFNSVLLNLYRDGQDSMGWHQDNEPELGSHPIIASLSLGGSRRFLLRNKQTDEKIEFLLGHGDLLIMAGSTQTHWQHSLPKTAKPCQPRINLTFRTIVTGS